MQGHVLPQARHQHASDEFQPASSKHLFCAQHMHGAGSLANGSPPTPLASSVAIRAPASPILPCDPAAYVPLTSKRGRESGFCQSTSFRLLQFQFLLLSTNKVWSHLLPVPISTTTKKVPFFSPSMLRAAAARLPSLAARVRAPATRRSMGSGDVKRHPDLERWNNVRDNVDQIVDFSNPVSFMRAFVAVVVVPTVMYKLIVAEGLAPNGDGSTGVVLARKIKKETAAAAAE